MRRCRLKNRDCFFGMLSPPNIYINRLNHWTWGHTQDDQHGYPRLFKGMGSVWPVHPACSLAQYQPPIKWACPKMGYPTGSSYVFPLEIAIFSDILRIPPNIGPRSHDESLPPITKPPQIIKTIGSICNFGKFQIGQFDFYLIPFRKQFKNKATTCGFRPPKIKTSQPRGVYYWGPPDFFSFFILGLLIYY